MMPIIIPKNYAYKKNNAYNSPSCPDPRVHECSERSLQHGNPPPLPGAGETAAGARAAAPHGQPPGADRLQCFLQEHTQCQGHPRDDTIDYNAFYRNTHSAKDTLEIIL